MIRIDSKDNKNLKKLRQLEQKKYRELYKQYVVEGWRSIHDILPEGVLNSIFIAESEINKTQTANLLEKVKNIPIYCLKNELASKLSFTENAQGVWGIADKPQNSIDDFLASFKVDNISKELYLLLDNIQDPGNLGTIIRTALAAGVKALFLSKDCVDEFNPKVVRSTMSALCKLPVYSGLTDKHISELLKIIPSYALTINTLIKYNEVQYNSPTMLILGNEGNGIRPWIIEEAMQEITIPMYGNIESLNISIAAAIAMYKVAEQYQG